MSWQTKIASKLREIRFICCQASGHSAGVRSFINTNYQSVKDAAPRFPFIVRECENAIPLIIARYDFGVERKVVAENLSEAEVKQAVEDLISQADSINSHRFLNKA
ncbi:unnamed protein product [Blepharisma stoltei]|uniref:Ribosomal protein/NADH dehydrogenase domain-containing protein n=1 Tax=Blepharisma stoltei TaxID=1481888 RepID=A0AAU9IT98_9CILI|nr:unnamed protein product [Blepharisma stoltei]